MPLEIHCFSTTSAWTDDEEIQADIIEHLLAILPEFHLRRYQAPGGRCLTETQLEPATAAPEVPRLHTRISPAAPNIEAADQGQAERQNRQNEQADQPDNDNSGLAGALDHPQQLARPTAGVQRRQNVAGRRAAQGPRGILSLVHNQFERGCEPGQHRVGEAVEEPSEQRPDQHGQTDQNPDERTQPSASNPPSSDARKSLGRMAIPAFRAVRQGEISIGQQGRKPTKEAIFTRTGQKATEYCRCKASATAWRDVISPAIVAPCFKSSRLGASFCMIQA
ncbi:hypothetical protein [Brevundimonas diminuta]|uniref:hypothetical protein n=1 Tax=Brevundimonas diminuta TaxID=293 RepID=UPI003D9AB4FB